jgi:type IV secretory pathway TrbL component
LILDFYDQVIRPLPELIKIPGAILLLVIIVLGTIQFVKKLLKLFIVIAVILVIVLAMSA